MRLPGEGNSNLQRRADIHGALKAGRRHTGYRESDVVKIDLLTDDFPVATKTLLPITMTEHCDGTSRQTVIGVGNCATEKGGNAEDLIIISR